MTAEERITALEKRLDNLEQRMVWEVRAMREALDRMAEVVRRYTGGS